MGRARGPSFSLANNMGFDYRMREEVISDVRRELIESADEKTRESGQRFFKEEAKFHGVKAAAVREIAKRRYRDVKDLDKKELFALCEELLRSDYGEEAFIAFEWAYSMRKKYEPADFSVFESWLSQYVNNWAKCDTLCNHTLGTFVEMYPEHVANLKGWTASDNRWLRRAAAVTLILPARKGDFLDDVFDIRPPPPGRRRPRPEGVRLAAEGGEQKPPAGGLRVRDEEEGRDAPDRPPVRHHREDAPGAPAKGDGEVRGGPSLGPGHPMGSHIHRGHILRAYLRIGVPKPLLELVDLPLRRRSSASPGRRNPSPAPSPSGSA